MKHVVIIGAVIPEPASTGAGIRMMQLMKFFLENNYKISFLSAAQNFEFSEKINVIPIELNNSSFDEKLKALNPDIVVYDRFLTEEQFGSRVHEACPDAMIILDTEDLQFLRKARENAYKARRKCTEKDFQNEIFIREIASILRCDLSLIISSAEYELLVTKFHINESLLLYLPFLDEAEPSKNSFQLRKNFVSIGNFLHEPNWHTVLQLKRIWEKIRKKFPDVELHIWGAYASEKVYQLHNEKEGFLIKGRAGNVQQLYDQYRVLLAPIPYGAGIKTKLWESMKFGLPNITSSIGAEGLQYEIEWNGFVADDEQQFSEKAAELYSEENVWNRAQLNGYQILKENFDKQKFQLQLKESINEITENIDLHRSKNYLGKILRHHLYNSSRYMTKWIEEKNRSKEV